MRLPGLTAQLRQCCICSESASSHVFSDIASSELALKCVLWQGKRYAMPNTTIMMHHPSGAARGQATDIHNEARELMRVRNYVNGVLSNVTERPVEQVSHLRHGPIRVCCESLSVPIHREHPW